MEQAADNNWQITACALTDDLEAMFEELKTKKVKNIVFYAAIEENIIPVGDAVRLYKILEYNSFSLNHCKPLK